MSPLALYIEQVYGHDPVSPCPHPKVAVYPPSPPINEIFGSLRTAPTLDNTRTNRILVYPGSFNPPHRGHLHLLKHVFMRGTYDLNVIAAIIVPRSDESVSRKVQEEDGKFMFGNDERCLLWKQDLCFPPWAWIYGSGTTSFTTFTERLVEATKKDGYSLEFVPLYGAGIGSPNNPPGPVYGCKTIIMSDAARAAEFQRASGRLRDFNGCTRWRRISVNEDGLRRHAKAKASDALLAMKTICPREARRMLEDGPGYVEEATETAVAKATEELKAVLTCQRQVEGQKITLRFVKCEDVDSRAKYNDISSTTLREIMVKERGIQLRVALDWMALSADLLWRCKASWIDKARLGTGCCIKFQESTEQLHLREKPTAYKDFGGVGDVPVSALLEKSPSLKELGLVKAVETSPPIEPPIAHDTSPSFEEPPTPTGPPPPTNKKRRFSATGFEDDVEILDEFDGNGLLAEDADIQEIGSCHF